MADRFVTVPDSLELPAAVLVPIARLSDAGTAGRAVLDAETATDARTAIGAGTAGEVSAHSADTTGVHGIADTSALVVAANHKARLTTTDLARVGCVSIVDDDGHADVMTRLVPILSARGMRAGLSIITGFLGTAQYMTWADVDACAAAGWELLGHGHDYTSNLNEFPVDADLDYQLGAGCQRLLNAHAPTVGFTYPQAQSDTRIRRATRRYYDFAFGGIGLNVYPLDTMRIRRIGMAPWTAENPTVNGNAEQSTLNYFKACIDDAKTNGRWLVLMTHIGQQDAAADVLLGQVLDYITAQAVPVVTPSEGYAAHGHKIFMGDTGGDWLGVSEQGIAGSGVTSEWRLPVNSKAISSGISTYRPGITHMACSGAYALSEGLPGPVAGDLITFNAGELAQNYQYARQEWRTGSGKVFARPATSDTTWGSWVNFASTRWDQTAGRAAYTWDTINVREQLTYADTGWRDIKANLENGWTATRFQIRRVGYVCYLKHAGLSGAAATSTTIITLPNLSLSPTSNVLVPTRLNAAGSIDLYVRSTGTITGDIGAVCNASEQQHSWMTDAQWTTALPGTQAVSIPYM